ncbi:MAG: c-type cytochrome [Acidimicrobiia bacterium]
MPAFFGAEMIVAADFRAIGLIVGAIVFIGFIALFLRNVFTAKEELGSEIELAANRAPYLSDEELETTKLDRSLTFALGILVITAVIVPFYWLGETGRQDGAVEGLAETFVRRGTNLYENGAQCVNCHGGGGVGGVAAYVYQDADGQFLGNTSWVAPALNNVLLRYSEEEITNVLNYGRPGSPMAAWGTPGGGPLTSQQVQYLIDYIGTFQVQSLDPLDIQAAGEDETDFFDEGSIAAQQAANDAAADIRTEVQRSINDGEFDTVGEAVFNLGLYSGYQAGSLSCGRCHTSGWSLGPDAVPNILDPGIAACGGGNPSGIGFSLCGGIKERFPDDTWKDPRGGWLDSTDPETPGAGVDFVLSMDMTRITLDDKGNAISDRTDANGDPIPYTVLPDGDLADCLFYSDLWEPGGLPADAYAFDPRVALVTSDEAGDGVTAGFVDPPVLTEADVAGEFTGQAVTLTDRRIGAGCTIVDMPDRTSKAHYEFIVNGADAGVGYGRGGQSGAGMMPGFGKTLPVDLIQAVVDYEREETEQR